ncbi:MAG TPA: FadR/GntR family transcriptional regulator [Ktedonobacteraceae bacterium]
MAMVSEESKGSYQPRYEIIAAKIIEIIQSAKLQPGDRLPTEQNLGEQLGVSRAMVREAVKLLTASGYVRTRRGSGIYVSDGERPFGASGSSLPVPVDPGQVLALFEFRGMQEAQTVLLAIERITLPELRALEQALVRNQQAAEAEQLDLFMESDDAFHLCIARASHNLFLAETVETALRLQRWTVKMITGGAPGSMRVSAEHHQAIFQAIKDGRAEDAVQHMKNHIEATLQAYLQGVRKRLQFDEQSWP